MRTIKVTGSAKEKYAPDTFVAVVQICAESKKYAEAAEKLSGLSAKFLDGLASVCTLGEITALSSSVNSERSEGKIVYKAVNRMKITLPLSDPRVGALTEALEGSGAQWRVEYLLKDSSYRSELIRRAVLSARETALNIAEAAGVKLGELERVEYGESYGGAVMLRAAAFGAENSTVPEPIEASESVVCEWEIL